MYGRRPQNPGRYVLSLRNGSSSSLLHRLLWSKKIFWLLRLTLHELVDGVDVEKSAKGNYLSSRQTPGQVKAASAFLTSLGAIAIELWHRLDRDSKPIRAPFPALHVPAEMLSSLDSASTATEIIYKTADDDASPISAKITATATALGGLKTLSADESGHHKGDIEIDVPNNDVGETLNNFFKKEKQCNANTKKRGVELDKRDTDLLDCLVNGFNDIMNAMGNGQPLQGLRDTAMQVVRNFPLPTFDNQQYAAAFGQALVAGPCLMDYHASIPTLARIRSYRLQLSFSCCPPLTSTIKSCKIRNWCWGKKIFWNSTSNSRSHVLLKGTITFQTATYPSVKVQAAFARWIH